MTTVRTMLPYRHSKLTIVTVFIPKISLSTRLPKSRHLLADHRSETPSLQMGMARQHLELL